MADSNDVQSIERISAVVGESQIKLILSNQCIKAQTLLVNRLKRQFDHQKEISKFISTDNLKLEAEINNAEQEIKSLILAHESIKSANVELKKEWHLAKERTQETEERIQFGEKKYDELWAQCKSRYESLEFVQHWMQAKKKTEALTENIYSLEGETRDLLRDIKTKQGIISTLNNKRIIQLAEYLIYEKPKTMENIRRMSVELKELGDQADQLKKLRNSETPNKDKVDISVANTQNKPNSQKTFNAKIDNDWPTLNKDFNSSSDTLMPKLQLMSIDLDVLRVKLDQIKKYAVVTKCTAKEEILTKTRIDLTEPKVTALDKGRNENISLYFNNFTNDSNRAEEIKENKCNNFSTRKLINILEDVKLDKNETYNLVSKVNLDDFQGVNVIKASSSSTSNGSQPESFQENKKMDFQEGEIEEFDMTSTNTENILMPPSGFLDQLRSSQEKKRVSFELPITMQELAAESKKDVPDNEIDEENEVNVTVNSQLEASSVSDESFTKIKDMILKKHNLDLSPQFVYAKNTAMQKNEGTVKSTYFKLTGEELKLSTSEANFQVEEAKITEIMEVNDNETDQVMPMQSNVEAQDQSVEIPVEEDADSSVEVNQEQNNGKQVSGLLFSHGPQGIPDSLDISISTTGFEDADADFPQYSSLLLSPKADLPIPTSGEKSDITSQEVPNFLSGLRKTGLSIFGQMPGRQSSNADTGAQSEGNNFNFAFGTDKKSKGGIFNMFN